MTRSLYFSVVVLLAGLSEPEVATDGAAVTLRAPGLTLQFSGAEVVRSGREVRIRLPSQ